MELSKPILGKNNKEVDVYKWEKATSLKMKTIAYKQVRNAFWEVINFPELNKAAVYMNGKLIRIFSKSKIIENNYIEDSISFFEVKTNL